MAVEPVATPAAGSAAPVPPQPGSGATATPPAPVNGTPAAAAVVTPPVPVPAAPTPTPAATDAKGADGKPVVPVAEESLLGGDDKPKDGEPAKTVDGTPAADLELKWPANFKADDGLVTEFKGIAKESGLKPEQAQKLADIYVKNETARAERALVDEKAMREEWRKSARTDKEFGGEKFPESQRLANQAYLKFAPKGLQELLKSTGLVNHPEVIRHFYGLGKVDAEPTRVGVGAAAVGGELSLEQALTRDIYTKTKS